MNAHTLSSWYMKEETDDYFIADESDFHLWIPKKRGNSKDIARLIAAAPDLLNALRTLVEMHDEEPSQLTAEDWRQARAAIGKAGGWDS